ncbi:MAG: methyltransferase domain-containing protein [Actinomycetota bacterium]|nr:methyltransferase domain-containing protein [Actinomycetota bacterium]
MRRPTRTALGLGGAAIGLRLWRRYTTPFPFRLRRWISVETPGLSSERLRSLLDPRPGDRVLEIGPGIGLYSLPAARWLAPSGTLEVLDLQPEMLEETLQRARSEGLTNVTTTRGDAQQLPFADAVFDAAFVVTALGEIPDQETALRELRRVLKPNGRLVIGELVIDLHGIRLSTLKDRARRAGFRFEHRTGRGITYFARFVPA